MVASTKEEPGKISWLSEDLLGLIFSRVKKTKDRRSFSSVCKQWSKLEGLSRSSLRISGYNHGFPFAALTRFPNLVSLEISWPKTGANFELIAQTCPRLEFIKVTTYGMSCDGDLGGKGLLALGTGCPKLSQVVLNGSAAARDAGVVALLLSAHSLKTLVLDSNQRISDEALREIGSSSISILELRTCAHITDVGLDFLANGSTSKTLKKLVLYNCQGITNAGVKKLQKMCCLEHLDLSLIGDRISIFGAVMISYIQTLKELKLIYLKHVTDLTMFALAKHCGNLEILDVSYTRVSGAGIRAFATHKCLKRLVLLGLWKLDLSDVENIACGCPSLESNSVVVESSLMESWRSYLRGVHERTSQVLLSYEGYVYQNA